MKKTARIVSMFLTTNPGHGRVRSRLFILPFTVLLLFSSQSFSFAGSATWQLHPTTGDWDTAANWTPATVPNNPSDIATLGVSSITSISISNYTPVNSIIFEAGASAYEITPTPNPNPGIFELELYGAGIVNNSGVVQNFVNVSAPAGSFSGIYFFRNATAGDLTFLPIRAGQRRNRTAARWNLVRIQVLEVPPLSMAAVGARTPARATSISGERPLSQIRPLSITAAL